MVRFDWSWLCVLAALLGVSLAGGVQAGEREIVLREHLNRQWTNELVTYPFSSAARECHPQSVSLQGPSGLLPVQLSEVHYWPGGTWVKSAKLSFVANLAPLSTNTYTVRWGRDATGPGPASDLRVTPREEEMELATSQFAVRLLLGERSFREPKPPAEVPGPVVAMRLGEGAWFGGSRMFGTRKLTGYSASLIAKGPVFAEVAFRYTYAGGNTVDLVARVASGANGILWDAKVKQDRPEEGWDLMLTPGLPPLVFRLQMEWYTTREVFLKRQARNGDWGELALDDYPAGLITKLSPFNDNWNDHTQTTIPLELTGQDKELLITSRDPGAWVEPAPAGTLRDWSAWQHKLMPLMRGEQGEIYLRMDAAAGERKLGLVVDVSGELERSRYREFTGAYSVCRPSVGERLNVVKD